MKRALLALVITPILASLIFGIGAVIAVQIMLLITLIAALPLFLILRKLQWLQWWHALLAGTACGVIFVALNALLSYSPDPDRLIDSNNILYVGLGGLIGLAYWWLGLFRNPSFPYIPRAFPWAVIFVVPVFAGAAWANNALRPTFDQGRVISVLKEPGRRLEGQASVRLSSGVVIEADLSDTWPRSRVIGQCFHLEQRWSTLRARKIYEVISPFGGGVRLLTIVGRAPLYSGSGLRGDCCGQDGDLRGPSDAYRESLVEGVQYAALVACCALESVTGDAVEADTSKDLLQHFRRALEELELAAIPAELEWVGSGCLPSVFAVTDLAAAAHDRIAKDSRQNAQRVAREILHKADALAEPPRPGRKVPEVNDPSLREISANSWRIIYHLRNDSVFIVPLIHKRRQPGAEDFLPDDEPPGTGSPKA